MSRKRVNILIPIYQTALSENERISLDQCVKVLRDFPLTIIKPQRLDLATIREAYPQLKVVDFSDHYFEDIAGYNDLMLSTEFYQRFSNYEYILIYQLDAFVFRNELIGWCDKEYDFVGAPWVIKPKYRKLYYRLFLLFKSAVYKLVNKPFEEGLILGKVGNGGFSLRKVDSFLNVTLNKRDVINAYLERCKVHNIFNEDVFWGIENPEFKYPNYDEALKFSFDKHPAICLEQAHHQLPFGCHGWNKQSKLSFWKEIIEKHIVR